MDRPAGGFVHPLELGVAAEAAAGPVDGLKFGCEPALGVVGAPGC